MKFNYDEFGVLFISSTENYQVAFYCYFVVCSLHNRAKDGLVIGPEVLDLLPTRVWYHGLVIFPEVLNKFRTYSKIYDGVFFAKVVNS